MLTHITTLIFVILALIACDQQGGAIQYVEGHHADHDDHDHLDANAHLEEDCEDHEHEEQQFGEGAFLAPVGSKKISDTEFVVKRAVNKQYQLVNEEDCHDEHAGEDHDEEHAGEDHDEEHAGEDHDEDHVH